MNLNNSTVFEGYVHDDDVFYACEQQAVYQLHKPMNSTAHEEVDSNANCSPCTVSP